jgi:DNA adenine methylase
MNRMALVTEVAAAARPAPIVKWVGGKTKLLPELLRRAPSTYRRYFEPFFGGGALFFRLLPEGAVLTDVNRALVECYEAVKLDPESVVHALGRHRKCHSEGYYYETREAWNAGDRGDSPGERAATFIYLNKTCYNGLWRVNSRGHFNVPAGRYENPSILDPAALRAASSALSRATLSVASFERVLEQADRGDFVYFDPPYHPLSETASFTSYTSGGFGPAEQERLADVFRELASRGCAVMLSNSDTPFIRKLYAAFRIERVMCPRAINSKADARGAIAELIVTNRF